MMILYFDTLSFLAGAMLGPGQSTDSFYFIKVIQVLHSFTLAMNNWKVQTPCIEELLVQLVSF